jgi:uncharacterized membrane protein
VRPGAETPAALPPHVEETVRAIAALHADHHRSASRLERFVSWLTALLATPLVIALMAVVVGGWILGNLIIQRMGGKPVDPPPFPYLEIVVSVLALATTVLILAVQRRDDALTERRDQLTLQLAILTEQKISRVLALMGAAEQDAESASMAEPADPGLVLEEIRRTHDEAESPASGC